MKKNNLITAVSLLMAAVGLIVMVGWMLQIQVLTSIFPNAPTMKFTTALCFVCSSIIIFLINLALNGRYSFMLAFMPAPCLIMALLISSLLISMLLGIQTGIENLFVQENPNAVLTVYPGRPSVGTILNFILVLFVGLLTMVNPKLLKKYIFRAGVVICAIGSIGLSGHMFNVPILYFSFKDISSAMAIHTAVLFIMLGVALIILGKDNQ